MASITRFEEIEAWKTARQLTILVYRFTRLAGFASDAALCDQIRRAAVSVMSNIAEGFESRTDTQFINFMGHAKASAGEVRAQLYAALDQGYIDQAQFDEAYTLATTASRQLMRFIQYLENNPRKKRISDDSAPYDS